MYTFDQSWGNIALGKLMLECSKFHNFIENNISLVWSWIESWIAESCLVTLTVQTFHSYGDIMLLAKASESKQENPLLYTVEMANVESTFDLSRGCGLFGYISIHESKFQFLGSDSRLQLRDISWFITWVCHHQI
ncbi:lysophospholipid acyltransferase LPEAT2-like isoform X2 [Camellia sinensis]|uniref:lysophospholipid acyltransferase LPEAT2-like isoform X2 n=1 Tax=Camellia sinensis TaxID=4442 RepID=UPI001036E5CE|nr:lysophospholipid acyltransferase LPEAT2-like isoform X2 [Camellia sinensis]XP_028095269.1 lysophospholipid acyltransferase LPEAT2-like isoform X2 [Camellia sinensis]